MGRIYDSKAVFASARGVKRPEPEETVHPLMALQQAAGNRAVSGELVPAVGGVPATSHEQQLREEIAGALNVAPDDTRVDAVIYGDLEVARALKEARQLDAAAKAPPAEKPQEVEIREDPYKGLTLEQRERKLNEDALKEELTRLGITDEMILKGYRTETRVDLGPNMRGRIVDQWIPEGSAGRSVHTFELERGGLTTRVVTTTDFAKGGERTIVRATIDGGRETSVTTLEPGYGKRGDRAALEKTSTRWVLNPDGSVTVETLDKYGRPIAGRSWKPVVLKLR